MHDPATAHPAVLADALRASSTASLKTRACL